MYIDPFWCGVIVTFLVEAGLLIGYAIYLGIKGYSKGDGEDEES